MTIAQDWARKRNFARFRIKSIIMHCRQILESGILTSYEEHYIKTAKAQLQDIDTEFVWNSNNENSKAQYLDKKGGI